jgi:hypothetical protein
MGNQAFNLDLTAAGDPTLNLNDIGLNQVKIIRRSGIATDVQNQWNLQGVRDSYDNVVSADIPTVTAVNATGGLSSSGAIFTYGMKSNLVVLNQIGDKSVVQGAVTNISLSTPPVIGGNAGTLTYATTSSNTSIATVALSADTLKVTAVSAGNAAISVTAIDVDGSQISTSFNVAVTAAAVTVSGTVTYGTGTNAVGAVTVKLTPVSGAALTATSNASGVYSIANVPAGTYTLSATKTGTWGGVTGGDALAVVRHAAGISGATLAGLPLAAADVNNSSTVTGSDALLIVRRAAGLDNSFTGGDWVFSSQSVTVASVNITANITALAMGDVNASYVPASGTAFAKSASLSVNGTNVGISAYDEAVGSVTLRISAKSKIAEVTSDLSGAVININGNEAMLVWYPADGKSAVKVNGVFAKVKFADKVTDVSVASELTDIAGNTISKEVAVATVPSVFALDQNYPNPFNPSTTINYSLPQSGKVTLTIYNVMGQEVAKLVNEQKSAGSYSVEWAPKNVASGMYIYRINVQTEKEVLTSSKRLMLLK